MLDDDNDGLETVPAGLKGTDVLAILAVSTFLAAVGLTTFFLTTAFGA